MKFCVLCFKGVEDICAKEIEDILGFKVKAGEGIIEFESSEEEAQKVCYKAQTVNRVIKLIDSFSYKKGEEITKKVNKDFSSEVEGSFSIKTEYIDSNIKVKDLSSRIAKTVQDRNENFHYKNPEDLIIIYISYKKCYIGLDLGFDLSKRSYKLFTYGRDVKGTIAAALVKLVGFDGKGKFLDAFCVNGTIAIEAALIANKKSPWFFDKEEFKFPTESFDETSGLKHIYSSGYQRRFVESCKKNAAVMEVNDSIECFVEEIEEMGHAIGDFDYVVANLPIMTKVNKNGIMKLYFAFLEQMKEVTSKKAKLLAFSTNIEEFRNILKEKEFKIIEEREIIHGFDIQQVIIFEKGF